MTVSLVNPLLYHCPLNQISTGCVHTDCILEPMISGIIQAGFFSRIQESDYRRGKCVLCTFSVNVFDQKFNPESSCSGNDFGWGNFQFVYSFSFFSLKLHDSETILGVREFCIHAAQKARTHERLTLKLQLRTAGQGPGCNCLSKDVEKCKSLFQRATCPDPQAPVLFPATIVEFLRAQVASQ